MSGRILVRLELDDTVLSARTPASARVVGDELARQVARFQRQNRLHYFPPLLYCSRMGGIDAELMQTFDGLHWLTVQLSRREVLRRLSVVLGRVHLDAVSNLAYTLARVRPRDPNAVSSLAAHLRPNRLRLELSGRRVESPELAGRTSARASEALADAFRRVEVIVYPAESGAIAQIHAEPT